MAYIDLIDTLQTEKKALRPSIDFIRQLDHRVVFFLKVS